MKANVFVDREGSEEKYMILAPDEKKEGAFHKNYLVNFVSFADGKYWIDEAGAEKTRSKEAVFRNYFLTADKIELTPEVEKMSKSKGNVVKPKEVMANFGSDALRYWAASVKLGDDIDYQENDLIAGKKFVTKLLNASRFVFMDLKHQKKKPKLSESDRLFLRQLNVFTKTASDA